MHRLIEDGTARSPEDAARAIVDGTVELGKPAGHATAASKVKRLALRYRKTYPDQPVE
jgi:hypothetical protein